MARPQDGFGKNAKKAGYPARSVYKLEEIDKRFRLLKANQKILDLGAVPGSWTLYASKKVGANGSVLGIDIQECNIHMPTNTTMLQADIFDIDLSMIREPIGYHVVLSDMAPSTSGNRNRDQFISYELYMKALSIACETLIKRGNFVGKIFQGPEFNDARKATQAAFSETRIVKPRASRRESYEIYLVGMGLQKTGTTY